jgi:hypothetical protein
LSTSAIDPGSLSDPRCSVVGMEVVAPEKASLLVDLMVEQRRELARAQAALATSMLEFADIRTALDDAAIPRRKSAGRDPRVRAGEFASTEMALALVDTRRRISDRVECYRLLRDQ